MSNNQTCRVHVGLSNINHIRNVEINTYQASTKSMLLYDNSNRPHLYSVSQYSHSNFDCLRKKI